MPQGKYHSDLSYKFAIFTCASSSVLIYYLRHLNDIERAYLGRALLGVLLSVATSPLRFLERILLPRILKNTPINHEPVFILGHWRSGTTYLHNLLCQDPNYGYLTTFQALAPDIFLISQRTLLPILMKVLQPTRRPEDNVTVTLNDPQEDEIALAKTLPYSCLHQLILPGHAHSLVNKYCLMDDLPKAITSQWVEKYLEILKKASWYMGNKRLILKNPANTGRVETLLSLFPKAKFIHIYRNPYSVFLSMRHYYVKLLPLLQLQPISQFEIETNLLLFYKQILSRFLQERQLIPPGNLVEISFENLEADPLKEVRRIYETLKLPGFTFAESAFQAYATAQARYQKNTYRLTKKDIQNVNQHWQFAFHEWGYEFVDASYKGKDSRVLSAERIS